MFQCGNDIQSVVKQLPMATVKGLLEVMFSVGSALRLYSKDLRQCSSIQLSAVQLEVSL
jgi:hypothetical protein